MGILRGITTAYPAASSITALFAEQARSRPGAVAVVDGPRSLTYAELDAHSDRLAHLLRRRGVGRGARVGVRMARGHELVTAVLAILKAGGAYVPIDPGYPAERQRRMLDDAEATVLVTAAEVREAAEAGAPPYHPAVPSGPRDLAYVLFTSGSTGRPKGVMVEHRSVLRLVCATDYVTLGPDERIAQVSHPSFDAFTFELWGALLHGGTLCVIPTETMLDPGGLGRALADHGVTTMFLTAPLFTEVMADRPDGFAGLRHLLVGGDVLNVAAARRLLELEPAARPAALINAYGPTETTTFAVCGRVTSVPPDARSIPIGVPIANTSCYVLDARLDPVPPGEEGELFIGGPGVARGYAGRPEETAERFLPDPFAAEPGARMYRTGDRVRELADGTLEFLGRLDDQVKIRGFRVEPGEVQAALHLHPEIRHAAVVADHAAGGPRLVAYVVPAVPGGGVPAGTREFLAARLPEWMIPAAFVACAEIPMTATGKVDRGALPPVPEDAPAAGAVPPRTDLERRLARIAAEMLGVASVGVTDDFFALGGHSLLAMRLLSRVNEDFDAKVELGDFLYEPTIARLAAEVSRDR